MGNNFKKGSYSKRTGDKRGTFKEMDAKKSSGKYPSKQKETYSEKDTKGFNMGSSWEKERSNNIEWWNRSPMYQDATRIPFNRIGGEPIGYNNTFEDSDSLLVNIDQTSDEYKSYSVPYAMTIDYYTTLGTAINGNSSINRSFNSIYNALYSKTSGILQFQQADLAMFVLPWQAILGIIGMLKRAIGVSSMYSNINTTFPLAILKAMGFDPASIIGHQDELRTRINDIILNINSMCVPNFVDTFKRNYSLTTNIYRDEADDRAQLYIFRQMNYYIYHDTNGDEPAYLESKEVGFSSTADTFLDINVLIDEVNSAIEAWRNSSDYGIIVGSLIRAFGDRNFISIDLITPMYITDFTVDQHMNWQIQNMITQPVDNTSLDVHQDPVSNIITQTPKIKVSSGTTTITNINPNFKPVTILNSYDGVIDDVFIMEATRLCAPNTSLNGVNFVWWNTEIASKITIWKMFSSNDTQERDVLPTSIDLQYYWLSNTISGVEYWPADKIEDLLNFVSDLTKFKYAPKMVIIPGGTTGSTLDIFNPILPIGDLYRYTTVDDESLRLLNYAALQSIYAVAAFETINSNIK